METTDPRRARFAALDFETTGRDPLKDRVTEVGIIIFEDGTVVERWNQLVNPGRPIPAEVTQVTGITDEDVAEMPSFAEIADEIVKRVEHEYLLAYNATYDVQVMRAELGRLQRTVEFKGVIDPLPFCWSHLRMKKRTPSARLGDICAFFDIPLENAHRATDDAEAAAHVFLKLWEIAPLPTTMRDFLEVQAALSVQMEEHFARFRRGRSGGSSINVNDVEIELGPAFVRGNESDPLRYLYRRLPDVRDTQ